MTCRRPAQTVSFISLLAACWIAAVAPDTAAKITVKAERDATFSFAGVRTWAWHPDGPGEVKVAYSSETDPGPIDQRMRPVILRAVEREFTKRGLTRTEGAPNLSVHYYLLVTATAWSQTMGQFAPSVPEWGLPPFSPQTTALSVLPVGTFLIDMASPGRDGLVWRGAAQTEINLEQSVEQRGKVLDRAITDLFKRFPSTK